MTMKTPKYALVALKDKKRTLNYIFKCSDIRNFSRVSCTDIRPDETVEVKWQDADGSFDGYYDAELKCLAVSIAELLAKVKKNKLKDPCNVSKYVPGASSKLERSKADSSALKNIRKSRSKEEQTAILNAAVGRMEDVLDSLPKPSEKQKKVEMQQHEELRPKPQSSTNVPHHNSKDEAGNNEELETKYKALEAKYEYLVKLHSSCPGTIRYIETQKNNFETECSALKNELEETKLAKETYAAKVTEIAKKNVQLQLQLHAAKRGGSGSVSPALVKESSSDHDCTPFDRDDSPLISDSCNSSKTEASSTPGSLGKTTKSCKRKLLKEMLADDGEDDCMKQIRMEVCRDMKGEQRFKEKDGKICLGGAFNINAEMWKKHLRTASTDSKFMNKFPALLWKPADLTQRSLTGSGRSKEKKRATPRKVACVVSAFKGRLDYLQVQGEARDLRMKNGMSTLSRKFTEVSRAPRKTADPPSQGDKDKQDTVEAKDKDEDGGMDHLEDKDEDGGFDHLEDKDQDEVRVQDKEKDMEEEDEFEQYLQYR